MVEVESKPNEVQNISSEAASKVKQSIEQVRPLLISACQPVIDAWGELNQTMDVEHAEIELGLSFTAEGSVYIVKGTAAANYSVKLTLKAKGSK